MAVIDELATILGMEPDARSGLERFKRDVEEAKKTLLGLSDAFNRVAAGIGLMIAGTAEGAAVPSAVGTVADTPGPEEDLLRKWGYAPGRAFGSGDRAGLREWSGSVGALARESGMGRALSGGVMDLSHRGGEGVPGPRNEAPRSHGSAGAVAIAALERIKTLLENWKTGCRELISELPDAVMGDATGDSGRFGGALTGAGGASGPAVRMLGGAAIRGAVGRGASGSPEDLFTRLEGGDSAIDRLFNAFSERRNELSAVAQKTGLSRIFESARQGRRSVMKPGGILGDIRGGIEGFAGRAGESLAAFGDWFSVLNNGSFPMAEEARGALKTVFGAAAGADGAIKGPAGEAIDAAISGVKTLFGLSGMEEARNTGTAGLSGMGAHRAPRADAQRAALMEMKDGRMPAAATPSTVPAASGFQRTTYYNDNKTVNMTVSTPELLRAGQTAAAALSAQSPQFPGSHAPAC